MSACAQCGRPLAHGGWYGIGDAPKRHLDCDRARVLELLNALNRIWEATGCFRQDEAPEVAARCHDIAESVR